MRGICEKVMPGSIRRSAWGLVFVVVAIVLMGSGEGLAETEVAKVTASDAAAGDIFGVSVSISGDLAVVGSSRDDDACLHHDPFCNSGSAYVYRYDPGSGEWVEEAKLTASDAAQLDSYGESVSISGDVVVIGAYGHRHAGIWSGSAYVYRYDPASGDWVEESELTPSDGEHGDSFGNSVSISGDVAVIGAYRHDHAGISSGSAYVYRYDPASGDWVEESELTASDAAAVGWSVSVSGDVVVIGAVGDDDVCPGDPNCNSGSAFVYRYDLQTKSWVEEAKLTASDAAEDDWFGSSVSVSGDLTVIGAFYDDDACVRDPYCDSGSAYVFRYDSPSGAWIEEAKLTASDAAAGDWFGYSVSVSGNLAVTGAFWDDDAGNASGSAYAYRYIADSGCWIEVAKLTASDAAEGDFFGSSVSLSGDLAVIGALYDDACPAIPGCYSGSAYMFDLTPVPGDLDGDGDRDLGDFAIFVDCVTGPGGGPLPSECPRADLDSDGDVDWADFAVFQVIYAGCEGGAIEFVGQPEGAVLCEGDQYFMFVDATGSPSYQWYKDGVAIPGATAFFYTILDATADDAGTYHVVANRACYLTVSEDAVVEVIDCAR